MARTFSYSQAWVSEGGRNTKISAKKAVFLVLSGKKQISPLLLLLEKRLEKSTSGPTWKNPSDAHAHKHENYTYFVKNCVVFHHLAALFNNTNAVSKPRQGDSARYILQTITISCQITNYR